jgi:hypothetical protein
MPRKIDLDLEDDLDEEVPTRSGLGPVVGTSVGDFLSYPWAGSAKRNMERAALDKALFQRDLQTAQLSLNATRTALAMREAQNKEIDDRISRVGKFLGMFRDVMKQADNPSVQKLVFGYLSKAYLPEEEGNFLNEIPGISDIDIGDDEKLRRMLKVLESKNPQAAAAFRARIAIKGIPGLEPPDFSASDARERALKLMEDVKENQIGFTSKWFTETPSKIHQIMKWTLVDHPLAGITYEQALTAARIEATRAFREATPEMKVLEKAFLDTIGVEEATEEPEKALQGQVNPDTESLLRELQGKTGLDAQKAVVDFLTKKKASSSEGKK